MKFTRLCLALLFLLPSAGIAGSLREHPDLAPKIALLEQWIETQRVYRGIPGLAIAVVHDQDLVWSRGFGVADLKTATPVTPGTIFRIASITKTFTSTAILQLRDKGKLRLDDPVVTHLPVVHLPEPSRGRAGRDHPAVADAHFRIAA